jgi:hypothetical protein
MPRPTHINGIPIQWNDEADRNIIGTLIGNTNRVNLISNARIATGGRAASIARFGDKSIFFEPEALPASSFNGVFEDGLLIDFQLLADELREVFTWSTYYKFDYKKFISNRVVNTPQPNPLLIGPISYSSNPIDVPLKAKSLVGTDVLYYFEKSYFNTQQYYIEKSLFYGVIYNVQEEKLYYRIVNKYWGTETYDVSTENESSDTTDITQPDQYSTFKILTSNIWAALYFVQYVYRLDGYSRTMIQYIETRYADLLAKYVKDIPHLKALYEQIPYASLHVRPDFNKQSDLVSLLAYDKDKWFKDASKAVINILLGFTDRTHLYKVYSIATVAMETYDLLNDDGKLKFCSILQAIIEEYQIKNKIYSPIKATFRTGGKYRIKTHLYDTDGSFVLTQQHEQSQITTTGRLGYITTFVDSEAPITLSPLDKVLLINSEEGNTQIECLALLIKYYADTEKKAEILTAIRIGADILTILLGIASTGTLSPLLLTLARIDMALATADLVVAGLEDKLKASPEGRAFLQAWQTIQIAGIATALPVLFDNLLQAGRVLQKAFKSTSLVTPIANEVNIARNVLNTVTKERLLGTVTTYTTELCADAQDYWKATGFAISLLDAQKIENAGCFFVKIYDENHVLTETAILYKGTVIARGIGKEIAPILKKLTGYGINTAKVLENFITTIGKVEYGLSMLSQKAIAFRKTLGAAARHDGNIAVFEYINKEGIIDRIAFTTKTEEELKALGYIDEKPHAEEFGFEWLTENKIPDENVLAVYSELEPCLLNGHKCKQEITKRFPKAKVSYSYTYNNMSEVMKKAIADRSKDLKILIK